MCRTRNILHMRRCKKNEGDDYNKRYEVLSTLKNKKIKINNTLIEKYKDMLDVIKS